MDKVELFGKEHGRQLFAMEYDPGAIVHWYGDICQGLMQLAADRAKTFKAEDFKLFNECLDCAIAGSIEGFHQIADIDAAQNHRADHPEFLHEMRNLVNIATLAFSAVQRGSVGIQGVTARVLGRSLAAMEKLIAGSVEDVKNARSRQSNSAGVALTELVREIAESARFTPAANNCDFIVEDVSEVVFLQVDKNAVTLVILNLLHNAFKFTQPGTQVTLSASVRQDRACISVANHCGGIPPDSLVAIFRPFVQAGKNKTGIGLGLAIARRAIERENGSLEVHNLPGCGCIFKVALPLHRDRAALSPG